MMVQPTADPEANYRTKLREMINRGLVPTSVGVHQIMVYHDGDCPALVGRACRCDPDIEVLDAPADARHN
jgi:hypothetical protein